MSKAKIYIASAVFILLTIIKIALPGLNTHVAATLNSAFEMEQAQTDEMLEYGEKAIKSILSGSADAHQRGLKCLSAEDRKYNAFAEKAREHYADIKDEYEIMREKSEKVEAFAARQSAVTSSSIPQNVMLQIPEIGFEYTQPVEGVTSSGFGYRVHPISNEIKFHYGTDFAADTGTPVRAFADGSIIAAGSSDSYGNYVIIDHGNGFSTMYAHCSKLCMGCGEVKMGDTIALVGATGLATGPHLHFEIKYDGQYLNPEFYL